jgi:hypothetical protein
MASKTLALGLYKVWAHRVCFAKPPLKFENPENPSPQESEQPWEYVTHMVAVVQFFFWSQGSAALLTVSFGSTECTEPLLCFSLSLAVIQ